MLQAAPSSNSFSLDIQHKPNSKKASSPLQSRRPSARLQKGQAIFASKERRDLLVYMASRPEASHPPQTPVTLPCPSQARRQQQQQAGCPPPQARDPQVLGSQNKRGQWLRQLCSLTLIIARFSRLTLEPINNSRSSRRMPTA